MKDCCEQSGPVTNSNAIIYPEHWHPESSGPKDGTEIEFLTEFKRWPEDPAPMLCEDYGYWTDFNGGGWVHQIPGVVLWWRPKQ